MAEAEKGLVIVYTGNGKGKTSAALGTVFRALGHGWKVLVIQFFKGDWPVVFGELESAKNHKNLEVLQIGRGFVGIMGDKKPIGEHRAAAAEAMRTAKEKAHSGKYDLVVLDEVNNAADPNGPRLIEINSLLDFIASRPPRLNLVLTGRNAHPLIVEIADLVTEMKEVKHPFSKGFSARKGIDF
jgi:cob(I)alamin adenosyltransferase